ncbi:hypothetical protein, partial [Hydrogenophaga sp. 5NK40-0174]|uniref:hypothetical protein n=1 Tax=Hydrogenophaga sp. 5NK40-0174 TaxID=3127649 RepID=UPI003342AB26
MANQILGTSLHMAKWGGFALVVSACSVDTTGLLVIAPRHYEVECEARYSYQTTDGIDAESTLPITAGYCVAYDPDVFVDHDILRTNACAIATNVDVQRYEIPEARPASVTLIEFTPQTPYAAGWDCVPGTYGSASDGLSDDDEIGSGSSMLS